MNGAANRNARNSTSPPKPVISTSIPGSTINKIAVTRRPRTRQLRQAPSRAIAGGQDHHPAAGPDHHQLGAGGDGGGLLQGLVGVGHRLPEADDQLHDVGHACSCGRR